MSRTNTERIGSWPNSFSPTFSKVPSRVCHGCLQNVISLYTDKLYFPINTLELHFIFSSGSLMLLMKTFMPFAVKQPDNFDDISLTKAKFRKYLKKDCSSKLYLQLSFKYFANLYFISKLSSKVWPIQTTSRSPGMIGLRKGRLVVFYAISGNKPFPLY